LKWDEHINTLISAERDFIIEVVGQALGEFREELVGEIEKMPAERVEKVRAEVNLKRASDEKVVLLPNPLCASGAEKRRPRGNGRA
jgi:hypothetical protein